MNPQARAVLEELSAAGFDGGEPRRLEDLRRQQVIEARSLASRNQSKLFATFTWTAAGMIHAVVRGAASRLTHDPKLTRRPAQGR